MAVFTNAEGKEPSPPEHPYPPEAYASEQHQKAGFNRYIEQAGLLGIDLEHCQAPTRYVRGFKGLLACGEKPICVMVENKSRPQHDDKIAAMALCARCRDIMLRSHGPDYAKLTPLPLP